LSHLDAARVEELLERAATRRVLVVGDLMLDRYVSGRVDRVSPEAPVPVVLVEEERAAIGGAGNVAANVTALGATCEVVGCVGDDAEGERLLAELEARRVGSSGVVTTAERPTTVKTRVHAKHQQIVRFDREVAHDVEADIAAVLIGSISDLAAESDALVVQDYNKGVLTREVVEAVRATAERSGIPVIVDPKRRGFFEYAGATVFKPNERELDDEAWMEATRRRLACSHLLVTLGDRGMALQTDAGHLVRLATAAQGVYDVSGAGDTVSATLAVAMAAGATVTEAAVLANHAAAVEVGRPGVQTVAPDEITAHLQAWPD
jgi:D-beta-D-heptose 7-phosphate kinase/D-beta-D-heptose 1-phosphate adenosyltransferase